MRRVHVPASDVNNDCGADDLVMVFRVPTTGKCNTTAYQPAPAPPTTPVSSLETRGRILCSRLLGAETMTRRCHDEAPATQTHTHEYIHHEGNVTHRVLRCVVKDTVRSCALVTCVRAHTHTHTHTHNTHTTHITNTCTRAQTKFAHSASQWCRPEFV